MFVVVYKVCNFLYTSVVEVYKKLYIGETGGRLGDPFREHLRDVEEMTSTHPNHTVSPTQHHSFFKSYPLYSFSRNNSSRLNLSGKTALNGESINLSLQNMCTSTFIDWN